MVRNFKGVVKVADVQEEFDALLNKINTAIDLYNNSLNIEDIDYNNAGTDLSPINYTLTIGGLKKVLEAYNGALIGGQIFRSSTGNYIVAEGIYIKDGAIYRLPSKPVAGDGNIVYFNKTDEVYSFSNRTNETGYYQEIITSQTSPTISGSNSAPLGTLSGDGAFYVSGTAGKTYYPYMAFPSNSSRWFVPTKTNGNDYTITWTFLNPTELQSITLNYACFNGGRLQILDLNNNVLLTDTVSGTGTNAQKSYTGTFNTGETKYNGIKIRLSRTQTYDFIDSMFGRFALGNIRLTGKTTTRVWIPESTSSNPEDFIPISMVNTNRISRLCNTQVATNEDIPNYVLKIANHTIKYDEGAEALSNSTKGQFVCGMEAVASDGNTCQANLFGEQVSYNDRRSGNSSSGEHRVSYWIPTNYLFIPKGLSNPYSYNGSKQRIFNYNLTRPERE